MNKFDLQTLIKYIRTTVSQVRKHGNKHYAFFWHDADNIAWQHYIETDIIDADRPSQRAYERDTWQTVINNTYDDALRNRKRIQVLLACVFLEIPLPNPKKLTNIDGKDWLKVVRELL